MSQKNFDILIYQIITAAFCVIVVLSNVISAKMMRIPFLQDFFLPVGYVAYPFTFMLTDLVTEIYGVRKAKEMVYIAFGMNLIGFGIIQLALWMPAVTSAEQELFKAVFGLSGLRIFASLAAYIVSQIIDIQLYAMIKRWTGERFMWLRNNGSVCLSQILDTIVIDMIYLYWGLSMSMEQVLPIMWISYAYKSAFSIANTPLFYLCVYLVKGEWSLRTYRREAMIIKESV